jgi:hypothetical protein
MPLTLGEYVLKSIKPASFSRLLQLYGCHANNLLFLAKVRHLSGSFAPS